MCHFVRRKCKNCHATLRHNPVNSGRDLAILGPLGLTFECPDVSPSGVKEVVEDNDVCTTCKAEEEETFVKARDDDTVVSTFNNSNKTPHSNQTDNSRHP